MRRAPIVFVVFFIAVLAFLFGACRAPQEVPTSSERAMLSVAPLCSPNDGLDDRACIQSVIDTACATPGGETVHLAAGEWNITRPLPIPGNEDNASLWIRCNDLSLEGEDSASTTLMMTGDGYVSDWSGVRIAGPASRVSISNLTIASDAATDINEQTHALMLGSTTTIAGHISNIQLRNLRLRHNIRPEVGGDCLRMVGVVGSIVSFVDASGILFEQCDRSGWAVHAGVEDITLRDSMFLDVGKTAIDMEPQGPAPIRRIRMDNLSTTGSGVSIAGSAGGGSGAPVWTESVTLSNSQIDGRVGVTYARNVTLSGVQISEVEPGAEGVLNVRGVIGLDVTGGSIARLAGSLAGAAVKVSGVSGVFPSDIQLSGVRITNEVAGHVVDMESVQDATLLANTLAGAGAANTAGVNVRPTGRDVRGLTFTANTSRGTPWAVRLAGSPANVAGAALLGNVSTGAALRCENVSRFTAPVVIGSYSAASGPIGCTAPAVLMTAAP